MKPPCSACNGYGTADGLPCDSIDRDFGPNAPGPCEDCGGTGDARDPAADAPDLAAEVHAAEIAHRERLDE